MNRTAIWLIATVVLLAFAGWLFRYDVEPLGRYKVVRLDRITGVVRICDAHVCVQPTLERGVTGERRRQMLDQLRESADAVPEANPLLEDWQAEQGERDVKP